MKNFAAFVLYCCCSFLFSQAVWSQDFSSVDSDLASLENLITDTLTTTEAQLQQLQDLKLNLSASELLLDNYRNTIAGQENLLRSLQTRLEEMSAIYRTQSSLSAKYERSSKFWKIFTLAAIPVTAAVSGCIVWASVR